MPNPDELFYATMEHHPVHGAAFKAMRLRPFDQVKLSVAQSAAYLEVTVRTLRRWQVAGSMPPRVKVGREKRYMLFAIQQLKAARRDKSLPSLGV
jgi:DNA-binding transcriptional regulator YiaG